MVGGRTITFNTVNLNTFQIQPEALCLIPEPMARQYNAIPLIISNHTLQVALADPRDIIALEALTARAGMPVQPVMADTEEIRQAIDRNYQAYDEIEKQFRNIAQADREESSQSEVVTGTPVVRALDLLIEEAIKNRASDIHIEPQETHLKVRYRIDGVLHEVLSLPLTIKRSLISRLKILGGMNIAEHRPQDGQFTFKAKNRDVDIRVATIFTTYGEMAVLRILNKSFTALDINEVGFSAAGLEKYRTALKSPYGMILASGPTGSGKTTTLYASLNHINCKERNIITIEDPVEYRLKDINQIQVNPKAGLTFASGLRAVMRHDPDVILVGEIRDAETATVAVQAALTGHLVLSSVHANDAISVLFRLIDLGVEPYLVASSLTCVVVQRLVRRICSHCQRLTVAPFEEQRAYTKEMGEERTEFLYGVGCNTCGNTGYIGRTAVFEILLLSDEIRSLLLNNATASRIREQAHQEGMVSMWHDGMHKIKQGITTPSEVIRNTFSLG